MGSSSSLSSRHVTVFSPGSILSNCIMFACIKGRSNRLCQCFRFLLFPKVRLTANTTDEIDEDPTGTKAFWDRGLLNGAPQKVSPIFRT